MKRIFLAGFFLSLALALFGASVEMEQNVQLYSNAASMVQKLGVLQDAEKENFSDVNDFYVWTLERLLTEFPTVRGNQEVNAANTMGRNLARLLGDAEIKSAAGNLWRLEQTLSDPMAKAEALIALGKMKAVEFVPHVIQVLQDLNRGRASRNNPDLERIAYGAIVALENYADPRGYLPVYFASAGWYSNSVKSQARSSLPKILEDPSEQLTAVFANPDYQFSDKFMVLQSIDTGASISNDTKSAAAVKAFAETWQSAAAAVGAQGEVVKSIRKLCIAMLRRYGTGDAQAYPLLENSYRRGADEEEKLGAIATLSALSSDDSVRLLSSFLRDINEKLRLGNITQADERLVRAVIPALGATRSNNAVPALLEVQARDWTNAVKRLAADALKNIPQR